MVISPAGHAILFIIMESACEHKAKLIFTHTSSNLNLPRILLDLLPLNEPFHFHVIETLRHENTSLIVYGKSSSIAPEFTQKIETKFLSILGENVIWDINLILNELMQNTVDHSTAERYFLYAGINDNQFQFGILDLGVSIPAKLEVKYICESDEEYLNISLKQGIGTRRMRPGGMGLYFLFENIKDAKGRFTIASRNAQTRKNFGSRKYRSSKLKFQLHGTWCMATIPLRKKV